MKAKTITKVVVIAGVLVVTGLTALYVRDAVLTNRIVARLAAFEPGTPFAEVVSANGEPDFIDEVAGSWKWSRRMRRVPDNVTQVAVYNRRITPQVCAFLLDEDDIVVEVDRFAGY